MTARVLLSFKLFNITFHTWVYSDEHCPIRLSLLRWCNRAASRGKLISEWLNQFLVSRETSIKSSTDQFSLIAAIEVGKWKFELKMPRSKGKCKACVDCFNESSYKFDTPTRPVTLRPMGIAATALAILFLSANAAPKELEGQMKSLRGRNIRIIGAHVSYLFSFSTTFHFYLFNAGTAFNHVHQRSEQFDYRQTLRCRFRYFESTGWQSTCNVSHNYDLSKLDFWSNDMNWFTFEISSTPEKIYNRRNNKRRIRGNRYSRSSNKEVAVWGEFHLKLFHWWKDLTKRENIRFTKPEMKSMVKSFRRIKSRIPLRVDAERLKV